VPYLKQAFLSDANEDLIITYNAVKEKPATLISLFRKHARQHCTPYYYQVRSMHTLRNSLKRAARMLYLNKTCFNGLWRVNKKGAFNVPIGSTSHHKLCHEEHLYACSNALQKATIQQQDYTAIEPLRGDFVYFDPPYHRTNHTSFTSYVPQDFTAKDHVILAQLCRELHSRGVFLMISNSNTAFIRKLYKEPYFKIAIIHVPRNISRNGKGRAKVEELLITNY